MSSITPNWLTQLRNDLKAISSNAARQFWSGPSVDSAPYFNYRLEHVRQVERNALRLLAELGGDEGIVLASVWIHDRFQPQYVGSNHAAYAAEWTREHLASLGFPQDKVEKVHFAVAHHSDPPGTIPSKAKEAQLLWDADKLTKLGTTDIVAYLCSSPAFPTEQVTYQSVAHYGLQSFDEAVLLVDKFYFPISRDWALARFNAQKAFYEALAQEVGLQ